MNKNDVKIILDAGHGGDDPGASGNGIIEKDLTLAITLYMYDRLRELGIPVKITRTTDETLSPTERVNRVMNAWGSDPKVILISNHINASANHTADGAEVIYALRNTDEFPNLILAEIEKEGQNIRYAYQRRLPSDPSKDYYFMQRNTAPIQSLTVEYGFLDSPKDDPTQLKNNYKLYAEAVIRALFKYLGLTYTPVPGSGYYTVQKGDSLWSIANKYDTTVSEIRNYNNLTSDTLQIGQQIRIPRGSTVTPPNDQVPSQVTYIVKSGDSLWSIANKYNTTVDAIKNANNLTNNLLRIGQVLVIPTTSSQRTYTVKNGDSLWKIALANNTTVDEIKRKNNLSSNNLTIGQVLVL